MQCALCLQDRKLCNSHIVPDFMFRKLQGADRAFYRLSTKAGKPKKFFKTFAEKLLCVECEQKFSKWEDYGKRFLNSEIPLEGRHISKNATHLHGADYAQLKLFLMSLLWRFGVARNPDFAGCDLGPHKERLRQLLLTSDPAEPWRYGCHITGVLVDGEHLQDMILPPSPIRMNGRRCYRLAIGGFVFAFYVTSHPLEPNLNALVLQNTGEFILGRFELRDIPFLADVAEGLSAVAKLEAD